jgi:NADH:ubiquinone oxidoreductase subunit E
MAALRVAQHQNNGWLTPRLMDCGGATTSACRRSRCTRSPRFYSMFETKPVRPHARLSVCTNIACMLRGGRAKSSRTSKRSSASSTGESTPDGKFFLKR